MKLLIDLSDKTLEVAAREASKKGRSRKRHIEVLAEQAIIQDAKNGKKK